MKIIHISVVIVALFSSWLLSARADIAERFGGTNNLSLMASQKSVTAWRTIGAFTANSSFTDLTNRFNKAGVGTLVSSNLVTQLTKILLDERSYMPPEWHDHCIHEPDLVLTLSDGAKNLDVFFCLDCQVVMVKTGDRPKGQPPVTTDSLFAEGVPKRIIHIMKQIFPKDDAIQALHEN